MAETLTFGEVCGCMVVVQTADAPTDGDTTAYLAALEPFVKRSPAPKVLVVTEGGAPGPALRRDLDRIVNQNTAKTKFAILTSSTFARGVLRAIRVINPNYNGFSPGDFEGALRYLEMPAFQLGDVRRKVNALRAELKLPPVQG